MIEVLTFEKFLKRKGKKPHTIEKMIREATAFNKFLQNTLNKDISNAKKVKKIVEK